MTCEHLIALEQALIAAGFRELSRGQAWSQNCREWVYFDCFLPQHPIRQKFRLADCVEDHGHFGTHDGQEGGWNDVSDGYEGIIAICEGCLEEIRERNYRD